jgi:cytochrome c553
MFRLATFLTASGLLFAAACSKEAPKPAASAAPATAPAPVETTPAVAYVSDEKAKKEFVSRCASCHGMEGKGDGPGSAALNPKPRNYTDKEWQKTVTDDQIGKTIMYGGAAVGKSPIMPAHPDLSSKPEMVTALVKVVRGFAGPSGP